MLADLIDIQGVKAFGKKWKPYPRPIKSTATKQVGDVAGRTRSEVLQILGKPVNA